MLSFVDFIPPRVFIAAFSKSVGGKTVVDQWVRAIDDISKVVRFGQPTPVFPDIFGPDTVKRWRQEARIQSLEKDVKHQIAPMTPFTLSLLSSSYSFAFLLLPFSSSTSSISSYCTSSLASSASPSSSSFLDFHGGCGRLDR